MIFYLVLRGLDTVEDDMSFPSDRKVPMLRQFHQFLSQPGWCFEECGEGCEKELLQSFDRVIAVFSRLSPGYQKVIADITKRMGNGMADFLEKGVDSVADWDLYCHYVAGLVGIGLSHLFFESRLEGSWFEQEAEAPANGMGLFLQKTNIIRDYREDIDETRVFWPTEVWSAYSKKLENFKEPQNSAVAVHCLNHLITNALEHVPDVLLYMSRVSEASVFEFCAIPQVMAIATLTRCFNNPDVFVKVVKIRRGETAQIFSAAKDMESLYALFSSFTYVIEAKIDPQDPNAERTRAIVKKIKVLCGNRPPPSSVSVPLVLGGALVVGAAAYGIYHVNQSR
jgi:farnesyl-diphosphate farnesyltransferase